MNRTTGEFTIKVPKDKLVETLKANAAKHKEEYETAKEGFKILLREELQTKLDALEAGEKVELRIDQQKPQSYYPEYVDVLDMLDWTMDDTVELTRQQFKSWVKDDWDWRQYWSESNSSYLSAAAAGPR